MVWHTLATATLIEKFLSKLCRRTTLEWSLHVKVVRVNPALIGFNRNLSIHLRFYTFGHDFIKISLRNNLSISRK